MLSRCALNGQPAIVVQAKSRGIYVTVWNMPEVRDDVAGTPAYLSTEKSHATPNLGTPIPPNGRQFNIWLDPGEVLWAVAYNEALLGVSVGPVEEE
jgi:hypothetical protein